MSYWCYSCDSYVISSKFDQVHKHFYKQKFGDTDESDVNGIIDKLNNLEIQSKPTINIAFYLTKINYNHAIDEEDSKVEANKTTDEEVCI